MKQKIDQFTLQNHIMMKRNKSIFYIFNHGSAVSLLLMVIMGVVDSNCQRLYLGKEVDLGGIF